MNCHILCENCDEIRTVPLGQVVIYETTVPTTERWFQCPDCGWQRQILRNYPQRDIRDDEACDDIEDARVQWLVHAGAIWLDMSDIAVDLTGEEA